MLNNASLDLMFREARTPNGWLDKPVPKETLIQLFDLLKMGPTSANCSPARFIFLTTKDGKERLRPALSKGNTAKTMAAPVTVIIGHDNEFSERLDYLFPHDDAKPWFANIKTETAFRNGTLQGAYLIMAARAIGLDAGPMSGFDNIMIDTEFFAGTAIKSNFICSLGYGDPEKTFGRLPRFNFDDICNVY